MIETFSEFKDLKNIDQSTMISVLEESFRALLQKCSVQTKILQWLLTRLKAIGEIWRDRVVVEDDAVEDPNLQIGITDAKKIDEECEVGEDIRCSGFLSFGRRAVLNLCQTLYSKILELQKNLFTKNIKI